MTRLPEKGLLSGAKVPRTTTGEMKNALGKLRDYLAELFGDDSADKESARKTLVIDLTELVSKPEVEKALSEKAGKRELESLEEAISKMGTPIGTIDYFAMASPPSGYLKADGAAVGRETYPELFTAIGTTYGEGDGSTTFNLPDVINRFAQGSNMPGQKIEAGLPNTTGYSDAGTYSRTDVNPTGCFSESVEWDISFQPVPKAALNGGTIPVFNASLSNPIYGASNTVQPPALTLLPCIKAFDTVNNPGLIDITGLANDVSSLSGIKLDKSIDGTTAKYITETYKNGVIWWRKWSDGWLEQGGLNGPFDLNYGRVNLHRPYLDVDYFVSCNPAGRPYLTPATVLVDGNNDKNMTTTGFYVGGNDWSSGYVKWYACGQAA